MALQPVRELEQLLTFKLADEVFALEIGKVREVLDFTTVTKVPRTPDFMRGVINLRGSVVPVVDLKLKFGMGRTEQSVNTCVIITQVMAGGDTTVLGCLADAVQEVLELDPLDISAAPRIGANLRTDFIAGMGRRNDSFIIILDIDQVFTADDLALVGAGDQGALAAP